MCGKFAAVSRGFWQTSQQNLEKFWHENCGPYTWLLNKQKYIVTLNSWSWSFK